MLITKLNKLTTIILKWNKTYIYTYFTQQNGFFFIKLNGTKLWHNTIIKYFHIKNNFVNNSKWVKLNEDFTFINCIQMLQLLFYATKQVIKRLNLIGVGFKFNTFKNKKILRTGTFNKYLILTFHNIRWNLLKKTALYLQTRQQFILNIMWNKSLTLYKQNVYKKKGVFIKNQSIILKANKLNKT